MRMNKYGRELELLILLTDNTDYTAQQLAEKLDITRRNLYYYFDYLRECGFSLIKSGTTYRLDRNIPFFRRLHENMTFNEREAEYIAQLLESTDKRDMTAESIRMKLAKSYNIDAIFDPQAYKRVNRNVAALKNAIASKLVVKLCDYSSPHSLSVSDRIVEPFMLMNNSTEVRCHEIKTHQNKTFKVSRMRRVETLDVPWINEDKHKQAYTDVFMFSGEERHRVELSLGQLSYNLLVEEYPASAQYVKQQDGRWIFAADVVSLHGVGRFVMGLFDDIHILGDDEFRSYIEQKVAQMQKHLNQH